MKSLVKLTANSQPSVKSQQNLVKLTAKAAFIEASKLSAQAAVIEIV